MRSKILMMALVVVYQSSVSFSVGLIAQQKVPAQSTADFLSADDSWQHHLQLKKESAYKDLKWRMLGPVFTGGRIESIAVAHDDPFTFFVAPGAGNLWKSTNGGLTWQALFEDESTFAIGCVAVAPSDSQIVWVGTGEAHLSGTSYAGTGVFKSVDGGLTWKNMGLVDTRHIGKVIIDPRDPNVVYFAAIGPPRGLSPHRGIYKTVDGGQSWQQVYHVDQKTAFIDLVMHPTDSKVLYATSWQRNSGPGSGVHKSSDAGKTWKKLGGGLPSKEIGRVAVDVSTSDPNVVYALLVDHSPPGDGRRGVGGWVYRSDDAGESWKKTHSQAHIPTYVGWDFCDIRVSPDNADQVYVCGFQLLISDNGGKSFTRAGETVQRLHPHLGGNRLHLDHHDLWIDPNHPNRIISGNDGGLFLSYDRGTTWLHLNNLPIAEFYTVSVDMKSPYNIYGGTQDNASLVGPSDHVVQTGEQDRWHHIFLDRWAGGDGFVTLVDPNDEKTIYYSQQSGDLRRKSLTAVNWVQSRSTRIRPRSSSDKERLRFAWNTPLLISPFDSTTLYCAAQRVFKSDNRGDDWKPISEDLTGGSQITSLSESPLKQGLIFSGSGDGRIYVTADDGANWTDVSLENAKAGVREVLASRHAENTAYLAMSTKGSFDKPLVFVTEDLGDTWASIVGNLPGESVNTICEDPRDEEILYVGTDLGVYVSLDRGEQWHSLCNHLPSTSVQDMIVHPRDLELVISTHGRGVFVLDVESIAGERHAEKSR